MKITMEGPSEKHFSFLLSDPNNESDQYMLDQMEKFFTEGSKFEAICSGVSMPDRKVTSATISFRKK